jgi:hypothetical protein
MAFRGLSELDLVEVEVGHMIAASSLGIISLLVPLQLQTELVLRRSIHKRSSGVLTILVHETSHASLMPPK